VTKPIRIESSSCTFVLATLDIRICNCHGDEEVGNRRDLRAPRHAVQAQSLFVEVSRRSWGRGSIDPSVDIGHVHLKVADIDRSLAFYCDVLGFELMLRLGDQAAFISAGGYHHHIGLNTWESRGGSPPPPGTTGLYHVAIRYPSRAALADALRRLLEAGIRLEGASDHGVSEALYLRDPDSNGIELYRDRPQEEWPRTPTGDLAMYTAPLDVDGLLTEPQPA
jgi:catechol 2,3-dioxygenase